MWCSAEFIPRGPEITNRYTLPSAGTKICWNCSDKYEEAWSMLHVEKIQCKLDKRRNKLSTENGYPLPITLKRWQNPLTPWGHRTAHAVDSSGKGWKAIENNGQFLTLKPV
jgi:hypothetical protein